MFSIGLYQTCQDVEDSVTFYIQSDSSFCVNCPLLGPSVQWTINFAPLTSITPSINYTVLPSNALLMRGSSQSGIYRYSNGSDTHEIIVTLASKHKWLYTSCCNVIELLSLL